MPAIWGTSDNGGRIPNEQERRAQFASDCGPITGLRRNLHFHHALPLDELQLYDAGYPGIYRNQDSLVAKTTAGMYPFADVAAGKHDRYLTAGFARIRDAGRWTQSQPYLFSFHHEQTVNETWQPRPPGEPPDYIAAFRHVHDLLVSAGAHTSVGGCIATVFNVLQSQVLNPRLAWAIEKCDPGADVVDVYGLDYYNKRNQPGSTALHYGVDAAESIQPFVDYATQQGRPWSVQEFAIEGGDDGQEQEKAAWLDSFTPIVAASGSGYGAGQLVGLWWTDEGGPTSPGRPNTSPIVIEAMLRLRAAAYQPPPVTVTPPPVAVFS